MKIQIKRETPVNADTFHCIKPSMHYLGVGSGVYSAAMFGKKGAFGNTIESGKQRKTWIKHIAHHMTMPG